MRSPVSLLPETSPPRADFAGKSRPLALDREQIAEGGIAGKALKSRRFVPTDCRLRWRRFMRGESAAVTDCGRLLRLYDRSATNSPFALYSSIAPVAL